MDTATGYNMTARQQTPARSDITATKQTVSIDSVMTEQYEHCDVDFIFHSFYLPVQVLRSPLYSVSPIGIAEGREIAAFLAKWKVEGVLLVFEGCCERMLMNAKMVGVSKRHILSSGQRIAVCKIWYGRI